MVLEMHDVARPQEQASDAQVVGSAAGDLAAYEALAPHLHEYARGRAAYLDAVDRLVIESIAGPAESLLDVGAGDGSRAVRIAGACGIRQVILSEPCRALQERCLAQPVTGVWPHRAEDLPRGPAGFDVITCLWNVLGHVRSRELRIRALGHMGALLRPEGRLFLDVNNRHNARAYGWARTGARSVKDWLHPADASGDVVVTWEIAGTRIRTTGHVFTPREMRELLATARLQIVRRHAVDYRNGARRRFAFEGQLLYELAPA